MTKIQTSRAIGVLTAGGDCPGLNACIRAVVRKAVAGGHRVVGIPRGYAGLIAGETVELDHRAVSGIIHLGGTMLRTARCAEMRDEKGLEEAVRRLDGYGLDGLVVIGGNGGLRGAWELSQRARTAIVGVPKTIDNDIGGTDVAIGFDSAVNTAMQAIDKIRDTARSHDRVFVVEVMGRDVGHLATAVGLVAGAEVTLIPEDSTTPADVAEALHCAAAIKKLSCILVVAEGWGEGAQALTTHLTNTTDFDVRVAVLGHIQRGGPPTAADRTLASVLGARAVDELLGGARGKMVGVRALEPVTVDLEDAWTRQPAHREDLFTLSRELCGLWTAALAARRSS